MTHLVPRQWVARALLGLCLSAALHSQSRADEPSGPTAGPEESTFPLPNPLLPNQRPDLSIPRPC